MRQVLFHIPLNELNADWPSIPVYGYGAMLFVAFVVCTLFATRLALREGIARERVQDLAIWMFIFGIIGARITYMIQYRVPVTQFFLLWDGGLVFYGSALGGAVGYLGYYWFVLRKHRISSWKMADLIAPCGALGLAVGRIGCLLNGCCYGNVACADCPDLHFPLSAPPRYYFVAKGYQTAAGFTLAADGFTVDRVEPGSEAAQKGLQAGDRIREVNGSKVLVSGDVDAALGQNYWPRGKVDLALTVQRGQRTLELPPFEPVTLGLHPTQIYESISMGLLFFVLLAYYPLRRRDGELMVLFMLSYAVHRFFNEMLRTDTDPVAFGMTLSQNVSVLVFAGGLLLGWILWRKPVQYHRAFQPPHTGADHHLQVRASPTPIPK
jgi:prolipoprotein diacylglyceryltransferase